MDMEVPMRCMSVESWEDYEEANLVPEYEGPGSLGGRVTLRVSDARVGFFGPGDRYTVKFERA
jgi:hypothetical protein